MTNFLAQTFNYNYSTPSTSSVPWGLLIVIWLIALVFAVISIVALWKVFQKAGRPGWAAIIPVYNAWVLFEISGKPGWWALISLTGAIPVLGFLGSIAFLVLYVLAMLELAKRFGKSQTFAIVAMIIFSFVGFLILGFGDAKYHGAPTTTPVNSTPPTPPTHPTTPAA